MEVGSGKANGSKSVRHRA